MKPNSFQRAVQLLFIACLLLTPIVLSICHSFDRVSAQSMAYPDVLLQEYNAPSAQIVVTSGYIFEVYDLQFNLRNGGTLISTSSRFNRLSLSWSPDGNNLAFQIDAYTEGTPNFLQIWNPATGQQKFQIDYILTRPSIAWSPDGNRFAAVHISENREFTTRIYNALNGTMLREFPYRGRNILWGDYLVIALGPAGILVLNPDSGEVIRSFNFGVGVESPFALSPSGEWITFTERDVTDSERIRVANIVTGEVQNIFLPLQTPATSLNWVNEGIISRDLNNTTRLWNPLTGQSQELPYANNARIYVDGNLDYVLVNDPSIGLYVRENATGQIYSAFPGN